MKLVKVIPIARGLAKETLSYFSTKSFGKGSIVRVPLRKKAVPAVVVSEENAGKSKAAIKRSSFVMRPISSRKETHLLSPAFIDAAEETAQYFATTTGAVLASITPAFIWTPEAEEVLEHAARTFKTTSPEEKNKRAESNKLMLEGERGERIDQYKSMIREAFAHKKSLFICVPTVIEGKALVHELKKGIESYMFLFHGQLTKKEALGRWEAVVSKIHPVVIIGTPTFLSIPRHDIETIVIERENTSLYKRQVRPYIDLRIFAEHLAGRLNAHFILAGFPLRVETQFQYESGAIEAIRPHKSKAARHTQRGYIVDMREENKNTLPIKKQFVVIGSELEKLVRGNEHLFIFTARRGLAPITVCGDCGNVVLSNVSNTPAVLYRGLGGNMFVCHVTGSVRSAHERCKVCASWRLQSLGIGVQRVEDEIQKLVPDKKIFVLDSTIAKTHGQAEIIAKKFYSTEKSILIGTEMALPYLTSPIPNVAVASVDSLLSYPLWRMSEKTLSLLIAFGARATDNFLIQTRRPDEPLLTQALKRDATLFYQNEIRLRKSLNYPPFTVLIKITAVGTSARVKKEIEKLEEHFKDYKLHVYLPTVHITRGRYKMHGLLRVPKEHWPDKKLISSLVALPQHFTIEIDPEALL